MPPEGPRQSALPAPGHLPALDGVRALAVLAVLLYHGDIAALPGGFLGVDLFFVLSGYLVSALLAAEFERTAGIRLDSFYWRRARRLLPALLVLLITLGAMVPRLLPDAAAALRADTLAALAYAANWWFIWNGTSYFDTLGRPPLLQHLWSLAIEEQFYLCWPLLLGWALRRGGRRLVAIVSILLAALSTGWMAWLAVRADWPASGDPSRLYFGTDTHAMGLFVGAAFAMLWRPWRAASTPHWAARLGWNLVGLLSLGLVLGAFLFIEEQAPLMFRGGYLLVAVVAGVLVASAARPDGFFVKALAWAPLRWLGERSYSLYLWHWPIFVCLRPGLDVSLDSTDALALRLGLTALCAELSYRWVEHPLRTGALGRLRRQWQLAGWPARAMLAVRTGGMFAALLVGTALAARGLLQAPSLPFAGLSADVAQAIGIEPGKALPVARVEAPTALSQLPVRPVMPAAPEVGFAEVMEPSASTAEPLVDAPAPATGLTAKPAAALAPTTHPVATSSLTAIGDSVLLGARHALQKSIADAETDAEVGRQAAVVLTRLQKLRETRLLADQVLVHLGTNGVVTEPQLRAALDGLRDRARVVVVNAAAPRRWVAPNNALIDRVLTDYGNVVLADWARVADGHPEFFVSDGVHLSPSGQRAFVGEIVRALASPLARHTPAARPTRPLEATSQAAASASAEPSNGAPARVF